MFKKNSLKKNKKNNKKKSFKKNLKNNIKKTSYKLKFTKSKGGAAEVAEVAQVSIESQVLSMVSSNGLLLENYKDFQASYYVVLEAVENNGLAIQYFDLKNFRKNNKGKEKDETFLFIKALMQNPLSIEHIIFKLKDVELESNSEIIRNYILWALEMETTTDKLPVENGKPNYVIQHIPAENIDSQVFLFFVYYYLQRNTDKDFSTLKPLIDIIANKLTAPRDIASGLKETMVKILDKITNIQNEEQKKEMDMFTTENNEKIREINNMNNLLTDEKAHIIIKNFIEIVEMMVKTKIGNQIIKQIKKEEREEEKRKEERKEEEDWYGD